MLKKYLANIEKGLIEFNQAQYDLIRILNILSTSRKANGRNFLSRIFDNFSSKKISERSVYVYGGVGCGKTFIMDLFCDSNSIRDFCIRTHWNSMMLSLYTEIHKFGNKKKRSNDFIMKELSTRLKNADIEWICLDEIQFADYATGTILMSFFDCLFEDNIKVFGTSNRYPSTIFPKRHPSCNTRSVSDVILSNFDIHFLDAGRDYREINQGGELATEVNFFSKDNREAYEARFCKEIENSVFTTEFELFNISGSKITVPTSYSNCLNFKTICKYTADELFLNPRGTGDFVTICGYFEAIFIEDLKPMFPLINGDPVRRFINFIDAAYDTKTKLFILMDVDMDGLFNFEDNLTDSSKTKNFCNTANDLVFSVKRTISRLKEMQTKEYGKKTHIRYVSNFFSTDRLASLEKCHKEP